MTIGHDTSSVKVSVQTGTKNRQEPKERDFALQIVAAQVIFTVVLTGLGWIISPAETSSRVAIAILCGGIISSLANLWLAMMAFRPQLGKSPQQMLSAFYVAEIGKFVIVALMFLIVFKKIALFKEPSYAIFLFGAFFIMQFTVWIYPLVRSKTLTALAKFNHR